MKYYVDIDIPIGNYIKIQEGSPEYSRVDLEIGTKEKDLESCILIKDSYYAEFGVSPDYLKVLELYKDVAESKLDWIIEDDDFILNRIRRLEAELEELLGRDSGGDFDTSLIALTKWIGSRVSRDNTTVREFYKMVKMYSDENKAKQLQNGNR